MALGCCQRDLVGPDACQKVLVELWEAEIGMQGHSRCTKWTQSPMGHILKLWEASGALHKAVVHQC